MSEKTVKEILADYLRLNGYDGLCWYDCGCALDDLAPCGRPWLDCCPGVVVPTEGYNVFVAPAKWEPNDD